MDGGHRQCAIEYKPDELDMDTLFDEDVAFLKHGRLPDPHEPLDILILEDSKDDEGISQPHTSLLQRVCTVTN